MKLLMVCLGNICRSPLAEGIMQHHVELAGLDWEVDSAGTGNWHVGSLPDTRSIAVARRYGIDISGQRARQFKAIDFDRFDRIYVMDSSNYRNVINLARNQAEKNKVRLIRNEVKAGYNESVPDPYYNDNGFEEVYQMLDEACTIIIKKENTKN